MQSYNPSSSPSNGAKGDLPIAQVVEDQKDTMDIEASSDISKPPIKMDSDSVKNTEKQSEMGKKNSKQQKTSEKIFWLLKQEYSSEDSIHRVLAEISKSQLKLQSKSQSKSSGFAVIDSPDAIFKRKISIDTIIAGISVSDTQKIVYHIFPIRFAPLKGKLRIMRQTISYHSIQTGFESEMQKFEVESTIIKEKILDFANSVKQLKEDLSISGKDVRSIAEYLNDPITIDTQSPATGGGNTSIAYRYKGIPATISITPVVVFTGSLDMEMGQRMVAKKIESLGLYISNPETLQWLLDYVVKKKKKAIESPAVMHIKKDIEKTAEFKTITIKLIIAAHLIFQLISLPLSVLGILPSAAYYILFGLVCAGSLFSYFKMDKQIEQKKPIIRSEQDLFKPEYKKYMDIHLNWMNKDEPVEFKTQILEEYKIMAAYYESIGYGRAESKAQIKKKKSLLQYIDTRDASKERILEQFKAVSAKNNGSNHKAIKTNVEERNELTGKLELTTKINGNASAVLQSSMRKPASSEPESNSTSDPQSDPIFFSRSDISSKLISEVGFERRSEPVSEPAAIFKSNSANEYDSEPILHSEEENPVLSISDSRNNFSTTGANSEVNDSIEIAAHNEVRQEGREKTISINIESGLMSNLEGDLVDSIKEFLNL